MRMVVVPVPVPVPVPVVVMMVPVFMRMVVQRQAGEGLGHHGGVQVATLAGVDLDGRRAGGADAVGVVRGLLVALDHGQRQLGAAAAWHVWWRTAVWSCPSRGWTRG
jgi:hypothetical protein